MHHRLGLRTLWMLLVAGLTTGLALWQANGVGSPARAWPGAQATPGPAYAEQGALLFEAAYEQYRNGFPGGALNRLDQALFLYRQAGDPEGQISTLMLMTSMHLALQQPRQALEPLQTALELRWQTGGHTNEVQMLQALAEIYTELGQYQSAKQAEDRASSLLQMGLAAPGPRAELSPAEYLTQRQQAVEQHVQAYRQALEVRQKMGDERGQGRVWLQMGWSYLNVQEFPSALKALEQALALARRAQDVSTEWRALNLLGWVYNNLGQESKTLELHQAAMAVAEAAGDPQGLAVVHSNLAVDYIDRGQFADALAHALIGLEAFERIDVPAEEIIARTNLGSIYAALGQTDQAMQTYLDLLPAMEAHSLPFHKAAALGDIGRLYLDQNDLTQAVDYFQQALAAFPLSGDVSAQITTLINLGNTYEALGRPEEAVQHFDRAAELMEQQRTSLPAEAFRIGLVDRWNSKNLYTGLVGGYYLAGQPERAFELSEQARARTFLDQMGSARHELQARGDPALAQEEQALLGEIEGLEAAYRSEISLPANQQDPENQQTLAAAIQERQAAYQDLLVKIQLSDPRYAELVRAAPLKLNEIQALLDDQTSLVAYYLVDEQVALAFVIAANAFDVFELEVEAEMLAGAYAEIYPPDLETPPPSLSQLYASLVQPLAETLKTPQVGLIPHGVLNYLPFAAFQDGEQVFGDQHILFYLPSATAYSYIRRNSRAATGTGPQTDLVMAQGLAQGQPFLAFAEQEAQAVAALLNSQALVGPAATKSAFLARAGQARIIHLAAHGVLNTDAPMFSRLALAAEGGEGGDLEVREIYNLDLKAAALVVLSACQTQRGAHSQGDDIIGLNRAFIYAGSPAVIASLWPVNDQATDLLMEQFYTHLTSGMGKGAALQKAQQAVRAEYPHPYFWAGFVLNGDAGPLPGMGITSPGMAQPGRLGPDKLALDWRMLAGLAAGCGGLLGLGGLGLAAAYWRRKNRKVGG